MDKKQLQKILAGLGLTTLLTGAGLAGAAHTAEPEESVTVKIEKSKTGQMEDSGTEVDSASTPCGGSSCSGGQEELPFGPNQDKPTPAVIKDKNGK